MTNRKPISLDEWRRLHGDSRDPKWRAFFSGQDTLAAEEARRTLRLLFWAVIICVTSLLIYIGMRNKWDVVFPVKTPEKFVQTERKTEQ